MPNSLFDCHTGTIKSVTRNILVPIAAKWVEPLGNACMFPSTEEMERVHTDEFDSMLKQHKFYSIGIRSGQMNYYVVSKKYSAVKALTDHLEETFQVGRTPLYNDIRHSDELCVSSSYLFVYSHGNGSTMEGCFGIVKKILDVFEFGVVFFLDYKG